MGQLNCLGILIFTFLVSCANSDVEFNSLSEKLVMSLIKVTPKQNVVASEHLVRFPLCKLASIASGKARQELMTLLGYKDDAALKECYYKISPFVRAMALADLTVTNRIYLNYTNEIDPKFILNATENDGLLVAQVGFNYPNAAVAHINNLISKMTLKRIKEIVDSNDINKNTTMIIISGAHYRATWESPFDYRLSKLGRFRQMDNKIISVPMMTKFGEFFFRRDGNCEVLTIRLGSWMASMTFVVPTSSKDFEKLLELILNQKDYIDTLTKGSERKFMKVTLPKFKIKTFVDWTGFLQGLGLYSVFNNTSTDLAGIYKEKFRNKPMSLNKIKQKVFIQIDEMGVARHEPDPFMMDGPPFNPASRVPEFIADKPFYFEVAFEDQGFRYPMLTGVYYGPEPDIGFF